MAIKPRKYRATIDKAGDFPVAQIPAPYNPRRKVDWDFPPTGVLHTTEGGWRGSMGVFRVHYAPHFILGWNEVDKKVEIGQLVPVGCMGYATRANDEKVRVQIEMIGYAKEEPWLPGQDTLDALCSLMNVCYEEWGIPLTHPWPDGDYGRAGDNKHRHQNFGKEPGWYGHADMPLPDVHWDPGNLQWMKVFERCHELATPLPPDSDARIA